MSRQKRWIVQRGDPSRARRISQALGVSPTLAHLLVVRGVNNADEARGFLSPADGAIHEPTMLSGIAAAVDRILLAAERKEKALLHGDYDVDGTSAAALLLPVLSQLGLSVHHYLPHRIDDGYGVSLRAVEAAAEAGIRLMITVDCGISAQRELDRARQLGIETIVTDHHIPSETLPPALTVIDPQLPHSEYPNPFLVGVGVAYKLAVALADRVGIPLLPPRVEELVALGSIADAATVLEENRTLIARGLESLKDTERPGLLSLYEVAKVVPEQIHSETVAFSLAPRLNALGRVGDPDDALHLLLTPSWERARQLAVTADDANQERKRLQAATMREIEKQLALEPQLAERGALVLWGPDWHRGVIGIVGSKLWDRFQRPAFVISVESDGIAYGSARSDGALEITKALGACEDILLAHGGHREAGGFRLPVDRLEEFRERIIDYAEARPQVSREELEFLIDCEVQLQDLNEGLMTELARLEPHGRGNPRPAFLARGILTKSEIRVVGADHLRLSCYQGKHCLPGIAFRKARIAQEADLSRIDIVFEPQWNIWQGRKNLELRISAIRPSEGGTIDVKDNARERSRQPDPPAEDWLVDLRHEKLGEPIAIDPSEVVIALVNPETPRGELDEWLQRMWKRNNPVWLDAKHLLTELQPTEQATLVVRYTDLEKLRDRPEPPHHIVLWDCPPNEACLSVVGKFRSDHASRTKVYISFDDARSQWQQHVLEKSHPDRDLLARFYLALRRIEHPSPIPVGVVRERIAAARLPTECLDFAFTVFQDLVLLSLDKRTSEISLVPSPQKRSLDESPTYRDAMRARNERESLARFLLNAPLGEIQYRLVGSQ
jgi:single-stranded-DNA-specific exonuclease